MRISANLGATRLPPDSTRVVRHVHVFAQWQTSTGRFQGRVTLFTNALTQTSAQALIPSWFTLLPVVVSLNAVIAFGCYLRVVAKMFCGTSDEGSASATYGVSLTPGLTTATRGLMVAVCGF